MKQNSRMHGTTYSKTDYCLLNKKAVKRKKRTMLFFSSQEEDIVAARLRSLRTYDPLNKGHPRSIEKEVEL